VTEEPDGAESALIGLAKGRTLFVSGRTGERSVSVELWSGERDLSDGLSVVTDGESLVGVTRIPLCGCGERGRGNSGVQLACDIDAARLGELVETLESLPVAPGPPSEERAWSGRFDDAGPRHLNSDGLPPLPIGTVA
jgi:hypothetical protein